MFLQWMKNNPCIMRPESAQDKRSWTPFWKSLCQLLNKLIRTFPGECIFQLQLWLTYHLNVDINSIANSYANNDDVPFLEEEVELRGFLPLAGSEYRSHNFTIPITTPATYEPILLMLVIDRATRPFSGSINAGATAQSSPVEDDSVDNNRPCCLTRVARAIQFGLYVASQTEVTLTD